MQASTLIQILKRVSNFSSAHYQIKSYGEGRIYDFATSGTTQYPALWADYGNTNVDNVNIGGSQQTTTVRVYISDRLQKGGFNETKVRSDIEQIFLDLISYLSNSSVFTWLIDSSITLVAFGEEFKDDELAGYYADFNFRQPYAKDRCAIPFSSNPSPSQANDYVVRILDQNGNLITTVSPGNNYSVTVLTTIRDTITDNTSTIIQNL